MLMMDVVCSAMGITNKELMTLNVECGEYLALDNLVPLYKLLPVGYRNCHKVKIRLKQPAVDHRLSDIFSDVLTYPNLLERCISTHTELPPIHNLQDVQPFYVFPIDGYNTVYNDAVSNLSSLQHTLDNLAVDLGEASISVAADLISTTYVRNTLPCTRDANIEVLIFKIPHYYAVRVSSAPDHAKLINDIKSINRIEQE